MQIWFVYLTTSLAFVQIVLCLNQVDIVSRRTPAPTSESGKFHVKYVDKFQSLNAAYKILLWREEVTDSKNVFSSLKIL